MVAQVYRGQLVKPERLDEVLSPAYDSLTSAQRRQYRVDNPLCYLHVTRSAPDEDDAATVDNPTLVRRGRQALERMLAADVLVDLDRPAYLIYELATEDHRQRGLVCEVPAREFADRARPHEATHADRAVLLAEHFLGVGAASSPVAVTIADGENLSEMLDRVADAAEPMIEHVGADGLTQRVWAVTDTDAERAISDAVSERDMFIVDGHHRAAANAALVERSVELPLLTVIFPPDSLRLAGFHRLLALPEGVTPDRLIAEVGRRFRVETVAHRPEPTPGRVVSRTEAGWHEVHFDERPVSGSAQVRLGSLDPVVLEREIVKAVESRFGPVQVDYMPAKGDDSETIDYAATHGLVPFLVPPLEVADMIEVASGGLIMPPKSTYFVPKVRSGLFVRLYDRSAIA